MANLVAIFVFLSITAGEIFRPQLITSSGIKFLDASILILDLLGLVFLRFKLKRPPQWILAFGVFILIALMSLIFSPLQLITGEYFTSVSYTLRIAAFILFGWLLFSGAFGKLILKMNTILVLSGITLAFLGLLQLIFIPNLAFLASDGWDPHYFRTVSTFLDPNFLGIYLSLTMATFIIKPPQFVKGKLIFIFFIILYLALVTTFSRSAYLAFFIIFALLAILKRSPKLALLTVICSLGIAVSMLSYTQVVAKPRNIDRQKSAEYRIGSWEMGLKLVESSPFLGIGFNSYRYGLRQYQLAPKEVIEGHGGSGNDSSLLFAAATTGTLGLLSYLFFLGTIFYLSLKNYLKNKKNSAIILISGIGGLLASSFFVNSLFYPWMLLWLVSSAAQLDQD